MAITVTGRVRKDRNTIESPLQHIAVLGDSIAFGAAATGATPPKWLNSWPGKLRQMLDTTYGQFGTGVVIANSVLPGNPSWDPRWGFGGSVALTSWGFHKASVFTIAAGAANYVEFTTSASSFRTWVLAGTAGVVNVSIDGGATIVCRNVATGGTSPDIERDTTTRPDHIVTTIPAGTAGPHTIRIWGNGGDVNLLAVEGRTGAGGVELSNPSISGKSLTSLFGGSGNNDETTGRYGLPLVDTLRASLLIVALGANDWQGSATIANVKTWLNTLITRQQPNGGTMLYLPPIPSSSLQPGGSPTWADYQAAFVDVAATRGVPFLDNTFLYGPDYASGNAAGKYADTIHPSDSGAADIAASVRSFLGV